MSYVYIMNEKAEFQKNFSKFLRNLRKETATKLGFDEMSKRKFGQYCEEVLKAPFGYNSIQQWEGKSSFPRYESLSFFADMVGKHIGVLFAELAGIELYSLSLKQIKSFIAEMEEVEKEDLFYQLCDEVNLSPKTKKDLIGEWIKSVELSADEKMELARSILDR